MDEGDLQRFKQGLNRPNPLLFIYLFVIDSLFPRPSLIYLDTSWAIDYHTTLYNLEEIKKTDEKASAEVLVAFVFFRAGATDNSRFS